MAKFNNTMNVLKLLPKTNCRKCNKPTCLAFAAALSRGEADRNQCSGLLNPISEYAVYPVYDKNGNLTSTVNLEIDSTANNEAGQNEIETDLTDREIEVLKLLARGLTNNEISGILFISPHTVKTHVANIFEKLGVNDRTQAAVWATRNNLV